MEPDETSCSLTEKYKIKNDDDDDSKNWASLLDFESPIKVESDWYSTQTFQVFLDALDINQPPTSLGGGKNPNTNGSSSTVGGNSDKTSSTLLKHNVNNDKQQPIEGQEDRDKIANTTKQKHHEQNNSFETILSAEALKILSDLPDLSHMSATRSFVFPTHTLLQPPPTTRNTQKTKINSSKR